MCIYLWMLLNLMGKNVCIITGRYFFVLLCHSMYFRCSTGQRMNLIANYGTQDLVDHFLSAGRGEVSFSWVQHPRACRLKELRFLVDDVTDRGWISFLVFSRTCTGYSSLSHFHFHQNIWLYIHSRVDDFSCCVCQGLSWFVPSWRSVHINKFTLYLF